MVQIDTTAEIDAVRFAEQAGNPATPAAGYWLMYAKADGVYRIDDAGDVVGPIPGVPTAWTPTITQSGAVTKTVNYAVYVLIGDLCYITAQMTMTGAGTGANDIVISNLPKTPAANGVYGTGYVNNDGTAFYVGAAIYIASNGGISFRAHLETDDIGSDPNFALASGDSINFTAIYPY